MSDEYPTFDDYEQEAEEQLRAAMTHQSTSSALLELAERVEKATGPDRELDGEIEAALQRYPEGWSREHFVEDIEVDFHHVANGRVGLRPGIVGGRDVVRWSAPEFTASIDAAMTLVPEGWRRWIYDADEGRCICRIEREDEDLPELEVGSNAATWPLAITAAALRSRATGAEE